MKIENKFRAIIRSGGLKRSLLMILLFSIIFVLSALPNVYAVGVYSKNDKPFNISYDDWAHRFGINGLARIQSMLHPKQVDAYWLIMVINQSQWLC